MKKQLKLAIVVVSLLTVSITNAQIIGDGSGANKIDLKKVGGSGADKDKKDKGNKLGQDRVVRLVDNKGNIKYLQVQNGLTTLTEKVKGRFVTTWQLGGELKSNTYITTDATNSTAKDKKIFALDGLELVTDVSTASINSDSDLNGSKHSIAPDGTVASTDPSGFTVIIRDEATGALQKIRLADLLDIKSEEIAFEIGSGSDLDNEYAIAAKTSVDVVDENKGCDLNFKTIISKVQVYRNGVKLLAGRDYKIKDFTPSGGAEVSKVYLVPQDKPNSIHYWELADEDMIEIHATK